MRGYDHTPVSDRFRDQLIKIQINGIETKVRFRVSKEKWSPSFEHISINLFGVTYKEAATIIWTAGRDTQGNAVAKYGWSISSEEELWDSVNTLGYKGKRWTYNSADDCMEGLVKYVKKCLVTGNLEWK